MGRKRIRLRVRGDQVIWLTVILMCLISVVMIYSSTSTLAYRQGGTPMDYTIKQFVYFLIGIGGMFLCYMIPLKWWRKLSYLLLGLSVVLLLAAVLTPFPRRITIGERILPLQPSELAKIAVILYLGRILEISRMETFKEYALKVLVPLGTVCTLTLIGSVSATLIILTVSGIILLSSGIRWSHLGYTLLIIIAAGGIATGIYFISEGEHVKRVGTAIARIERHFMSEEEARKTMTPAELKEYTEKMEQTKHAREAVQLGGITGRGPGNGLKKFVLPNSFDDFVFATLVEEWGLVGAVVLMAIYAVFFYRCLNIARLCHRTFTIVSVLGLSSLVVLQAMLHICVNIGMFPVTGQTLPLISNGGTSIVILSCAVGIILSINRTIEVTEEKGRIIARQIEEEKAREEERIKKEIDKIG